MNLPDPQSDSAVRPDAEPVADSGRETKWHQGSPMLRSFGVALLAVGIVGLLLMVLLYVLTGNDAVYVAVPVMVVFVLIGGMLLLQSRRPTRR